jgi:hypothetical protein
MYCRLAEPETMMGIMQMMICVVKCLLHVGRPTLWPLRPAYNDVHPPHLGTEVFSAGDTWWLLLHPTESTRELLYILLLSPHLETL